VGDVNSGIVENLPERVGIVSFEAQQELIEAERRKDDADIMDVISEVHSESSLPESLAR